MTILKRLLSHPLTCPLDIDDPRTTHLRRRIIRETPFLRHIYEDWYHLLVNALPVGSGRVLELGSGGGFLYKHVPELITSEIFHTPGICVVLDAFHLPLQENALRGIVMTNVFHHLSRPRDFFREATRAVRPGGIIAMIEPWVNPWASLIYSKLHNEPFMKTSSWEFPASGPLSGANLALPWIVFKRDISIFEREFPDWRISHVKPFMPLSYLLSGGVSMRCLLPGWSTPICRTIERRMFPSRTGMFAYISLEKVRGLHSVGASRAIDFKNR